ncbi:hypothetical protein [Mucilaginibacter boryungensis]|nr:hypothetical protein [Mucilaginibacter boryungensis]
MSIPNNKSSACPGILIAYRFDKATEMGPIQMVPGYANMHTY